MSSDCAEVYRLSSASFLAPSISFFRRSGPAYKPTSAAVAFGLTCPGTEAGRTAPATNRLARRLNPGGFIPYPLTFEEEIRPKFLPVVGLVERDDRVDHLEGELVEVCFHGAARGHPVALLQDRLAFEGEHEVGKEQRRVRMRRAARHADRVGAPERRFERLPPDRRAFHYQALGVVIVNGRRDRDLAGGDQLRHQGMPRADLGPRGGKLLKEREPLLLAHRLHHGAEPVDVARLDPHLAREARAKEVLIAVGNVARFDELGVVRDREEVEPVGDIVTVLGERGGGQIGEVRTIELFEQPLAVHGLHLGPVGLEDVAGEAPGARFGDGALQNLLRARAPKLDLHPRFLLEGLGDRHRVLEVERGVHDDLAFLACGLKNPLVAVGAAVQIDRAVLRGLVPLLAEARDRPQRGAQRARENPPPAGVKAIASGHVSCLLPHERPAWDLPMKNTGGRLSRPPASLRSRAAPYSAGLAACAASQRLYTSPSAN